MSKNQTLVNTSLDFTKLYTEVNELDLVGVDEIKESSEMNKELSNGRGEDNA